MEKLNLLLVAVLVVLSGLAKADGAEKKCAENEERRCTQREECACVPKSSVGRVDLVMADEALEAVNKAAKDGAKEGAREAIKEAAQPTKATGRVTKSAKKGKVDGLCSKKKLQGITADLGRIEAMATVPLRAEELEKLRGQVEAARQAAFECAEPDLVSRAAQLAKKLAGVKADLDPTPAAGTVEAPKADEEKAEGGVLSGARTCTEWCQERNRGDGEMRGDFCFCSNDSAAVPTETPPDEKKGGSYAGWIVAGTILAVAIVGGVGYLVYDTQRDYHVTRGSLRQSLHGLPGQPQGFGF